MVFDIGGTTLRGALYFPASDSVSSPVIVPTPNRKLYPELSTEQLYGKLLEVFASVGDKLIGNETCTTVSIGFPGPVDCDGQVIAGPGIWGRNPDGPIDMIADIQLFWPDKKIFLSNDLTVAGFRHVEKGDDSFCLLTVSTGIGSKVFINGQPQLGPRGTGGELGHAKVLFTEEAPICDCGDKGHLQAIASGRGVLDLVQQQARIRPKDFRDSCLGKLDTDPDEISNSAIAEAFRIDDRFTVNIVNWSISPLAAMLVNLHLALGLERFIIIGGFALALGESYRLELARQAADFCWDSQVDWGQMIRFGYEDDLSGLIGAGRLANNAVSLVKPSL